MRIADTSILMGSRGSGKTATLNEIEDMAAAEGWVVLSIDAATPGLLQRTMDVIARADEEYEEALGQEHEPMRRCVEKTLGISLGPLRGSVAWTDFRDRRRRSDLRGHLAFLARAASEHDTSVLLTVDELDAVDRVEGRRLSNDLQHITRRAEAPLAFVGAATSMASTSMSCCQPSEVVVPTHLGRDLAERIAEPML